MDRRGFIKGAGQITVAGAVGAALRPANALIGMLGGSASGAPSGTRPLGLQPGGPPAYFDTEMPFLNLLKRGGGAMKFLGCPWYTSWLAQNQLDTVEEAYLPLDPNGYATSLVATNIGNGAPGTQVFDGLTSLLNYDLPALAPSQTYYYPPGVYRLKYIGQGTVNITGDASVTLTNSAANTYTETTFTVSAPTATPGLKLTISAITGTAASSFTGSISGTTLTASSVTGNLGAGNVVQGTGVAYQTAIVQQLSGTTGGAGTYEVTVSQTVASEAMTATDHPRDISVVENAYASSYDAGEIFHPNFLALYAGVKCVRGMQWQGQDNIYAGYYGSTITASISGTTMTVTVADPNGAKIGIGDEISGGTVASGTTVTAYGTGTGGTGTYTVSVSQTVSSQALTDFQVFHAGDTSAVLQYPWPYPSGTYTLWMYGGQSVSANFTYNSNDITWSGGLANTTSPGAYVVLAPFPGWTQRTPVDYVSYARGPTYVPEEVIISLANKLNCDVWLNARVDATDSFITSLANLANSTLNSGNKAYFELSNETWNPGYWQQFLCQAFGCAQWPAQPNDIQQNHNWFGMRTAVMSELIATAVGSSFSSRCVVVLGAQGGNSSTITNRLNTTYWTSAIDGYTGPASAHKIGAVAISEYWGWGPYPSTTDATTMLSVTTPLDDFFACMTGNVGTVANGSHVYSSVPSNGTGKTGFQTQKQDDVSQCLTALSPYGLPLLTYELGDNFFAKEVVTGWTNFIISAERDARMGTWIRNYLNWRATNVGGTDANIAIVFEDAQPPNSSGCFEMVESVMQTISPLSSAPYKFQAFQNYIQGN